MQTVIIVIHLMIVLAMIGLVLLQKSEGGGLGMGGGGGGGFLSSRGTVQRADPHHRRSWPRVFFATSLILSILAGFDRKPRSILDSGGRAGAVGARRARRAARRPGGGVLDQLRGAGSRRRAVRPAGAAIAVTPARAG